MPHRCRPLAAPAADIARPAWRRAPCIAAVVAALSAAPGWASTAAHGKTPEKEADKVTEKAEKATEKGHGDKAAGAASKKAAAEADALDVLRERLAEKLGAVKPPDAKSSNQLRLTSKLHPASLGDEARHAAPVARKAAPAAVVAAVDAHRADKAAAAAHGSDKPHGGHWAYSGETGPQVWGGLKPEFSLCAKGQRQSPIDIRNGIAVELDPVVFDYRPGGFSVIDNGHTVQVDVAPGNRIEALGRRYELVQFHFHRPSEERVDGRQYEMDVHLVHKDPEGRLAVVAVLLDRGAAQPVIQAVWNNLPLEKGEAQPASATIDLNHLLPRERSYYTYMGSLTTPPCSEGVLWMVMREPVTVSPNQIAIFSRLYPMNARPVQSASGRLIKQSQ